MLRIIHLFEKSIDGTSDFPQELKDLLAAHPVANPSNMGFEGQWDSKPYWS